MEQGGGRSLREGRVGVSSRPWQWLRAGEMEPSRGGPLQDQVRDLLEEEAGAAGTKRQASLGGSVC